MNCHAQARSRRTLPGGWRPLGCLRCGERRSGDGDGIEEICCRHPRLEGKRLLPRPGHLALWLLGLAAPHLVRRSAVGPRGAGGLGEDLCGEVVVAIEGVAELPVSSELLENQLLNHVDAIRVVRATLHVVLHADAQDTSILRAQVVLEALAQIVRLLATHGVLHYGGNAVPRAQLALQCGLPPCFPSDGRSLVQRRLRHDFAGSMQRGAPDAQHPRAAWCRCRVPQVRGGCGPRRRGHRPEPLPAGGGV
mmetsp:Transcript_44196/g.127674  ORF Transcript_44196/g.127674 Transcript_44196/m.127674 type:complete len:250 (+) Transcript_44196:79-828(+)